MVDNDDNWLKQLGASLGVALGVALVGGLVLGLVALGAANVLGLSGSSSSSKPTLYIPPLQKSHRPAAPTGPDTTSPSPTPTPSPTPSPSPTKKPKPPAPRIVLAARPTQAASFERIYLTGHYRGGEGHSLQVQRFQGGWTDFPVTTTVHGAGFSTYVQSGNSGRNRFRVLDPATGRASNPVNVVIG